MTYSRMDWNGPILDNHLHLEPRDGEGIEAVQTFADAGGTHLLVVNNPSWRHGEPATDADGFRPAFDATVDIVEAAEAVLPGRAWAVLGVHPALISRLIDDRGMDPSIAAETMRTGIDVAAEYLENGDAVALKSGRPHYEVPEAVWSASNEVIAHAFARAAELDCAVQLHTEPASGFPDLVTLAKSAGLAPTRIVKHYADGQLEELTPSLIARKEVLREFSPGDSPVFMETDYLDDPDRPGAVLGPRTVPRRVRWLLERDRRDLIERAHVSAPATVYGLDLPGTLPG